MRVDPLVRRSLSFFRRGPAWSIAIALAVAALALARATAPLVTDASADRSFEAEIETAATSAQAGLGLDARAYTTGLADLPAEQAVTALLDALPVYDAPLVTVSPLLPYNGHDHPTPVIRTLDGNETPALVYSLGDTSTSLTPATTAKAQPTTATTQPTTVTTATTGIWVPDTVAARLGVGIGDPVIVALDWPAFAPPPPRLADARTTIAGVYATADGLPVSATFDWRSPPVPLPTDPAGGVLAPPLLLADTGTAMALIAGMDDTTFVRWDLEWSGPTTIERGRAARPALQQTAAGLFDTDTPVGHQVADAHARRVTLTSGVGSFVQRSEEAAAILHPVLASIALTAQVMSLVVLATCVWMLARSRRREHALSMTMGTSPVRLGAVGVLEQLVPIALGVAVAYAVVRWFPGLVAGHGTIDHVTRRRALLQVLWALPIAAAAVALAGFAAVWPLDAASAGRARRVAGALRAETILVVAALATGAQLVTQKGSALDSGTALLFPLLGVLAGASVVVRGSAALVRIVSSRRTRGRSTGRGAVTRPTPTARTARPRSLAVWLARRRVSYALTELSVLVIVVASGVGLFVYCTSVSADGQRGVGDKAAAIGGASATAEVPTAQDVPHGADGFPAGLSAGEAVVWWDSGVQMAPNVVADVLAVDPATFPAAAAWPRSFADRSLDSLLADITDSGQPALGVVVSGNFTDTFPDRGTMQLVPGAPTGVSYRVVARIAAGPWQRELTSVVIVAARALAPRLPDPKKLAATGGDAARLDQVSRTYVWSRDTQPALEASLGPALLGPALRESNVPNVATAAREPSFVAFDLSLPYLQLVGSALLVVSLASIIVLGARGRADLALELALTDKMGMRRRTMAAAIAGGAALLGVVAALIGLVLARLLVAFMLRRIDPSPGLPPRFSGSLSPTAAFVALAGVVAVSLGGAAFELRVARRARIAEVLRGAE